ncbi:sigma-70 family RNA polymerase sigma factor [Lutibacter sp. TH_r2]|uniref:RNA polymerase sigma factor n=1 Tax=Lutibacter sp. TH_r2 TaxID=3082083 RepID=UPI0029536FAF|nr:sigma-70 family RNA polymerase sigma factor [Lutibacter sp. TH_r2]MDV7188085.1 sigma-70 family RNA polymerase sigma factor [Lutibacter sp. TH_r2]
MLHKEHTSNEDFSPRKTDKSKVPNEIGDLQLWNEFQIGNGKAYATIYEKNASALYNYGLKIVNNEALVKDCIQDLFVELWNNKEKLGKVKFIKSYLYTSIRRKLISELRKNRRNISIPEDNEAEDCLCSKSTERKLIEKQNFDNQKKLLNKAISKLTSKQREILYLKYNAQLSYNEITQIMALSKKGAYKLMDRAIKSLKKNF